MENIYIPMSLCSKHSHIYEYFDVLGNRFMWNSGKGIDVFIYFRWIYEFGLRLKDREMFKCIFFN